MSLDIKINPDGSYTVSCAGQSVTIGPMTAPVEMPRRTHPNAPERNNPGVHAVAVIGEIVGAQDVKEIHLLDLDADWLIGKERIASRDSKDSEEIHGSEPVKISVKLDIGKPYSMDEVVDRLKEEFSENQGVIFEMLPKIERE